MTAKKAAEIFRNLQQPTPVTSAFDKNEGQKKNRWWDPNGQQYHVAAHFFCCYYHGGRINPNCTNDCDCRTCYLNMEYETDQKIDENSTKKIYNRLRKPEMFCWIIEALRIYSEDEMQHFIKTITEIIVDNNTQKTDSTRCNKIKETVPWNIIEDRLNDL